MKKVKKLMCSGLAFLDEKDMERLHKEAKAGWIFKEFKGLHYHLHKEEPKDLIFDYDMSLVSDEGKEEYYALFEAAGWQVIPTNPKSDVHFFCAASGTPAIHTEKSTRGMQYKATMVYAIKALILSALTLALSIYVKDTFALEGILSVLRFIVTLLSASILGASLVLSIGSLVRVLKGRVLR